MQLYVHVLVYGVFCVTVANTIITTAVAFPLVSSYISRLHFRPKTPPPSYESPCYLLPPEESTFNPDANVAFSLELRALDESSVLLDSSTFTTPPFLLGEMSSEGVCEDVPVTDTRQQPRDPVNSVQQMGLNLNVNVGLNTLNTNNITTNSFVHSVNLNNNNISPSPVDVDPSNVGEQRAPGCSRFTVSDISGSAVGIMSKRHFLLSSTLTSPKLNSANLVSDVRQQSGLDGSACISTNGIIAQFGIDGEYENFVRFVRSVRLPVMILGNFAITY